MATDLADGIIVKTDHTCVIDGRPHPDIPTLVWPEGIDEVASDWFRYLVKQGNAASSSAYEYAKILRPFLRFCRVHNVDWRLVDDSVIMRWRDRLLADQIDVDRIKSVIGTIFRFYCWAERNYYIRHRVAIYLEDELPEQLVGFRFPISARRYSANYKSKHAAEGWVSTISVRREGGQTRLPRHTPTERETRRLHQVVATNRNSERDSLILSWAEETGARRAEILSILISDLPDGDELAELIERDEPFVLKVPRKGGTFKPLVVPPDLIIRTNEFIENEWQAIVQQSSDTIVGYARPSEIFLSSTTGKVLHPDSVTSMGGRAFQRADIKRASLHRLRAKFAVAVVEALVDAIPSGEITGSTANWTETILVKAADLMGQASPSSLRPYINRVLDRRLQVSDSERLRKLETRLRQLHLTEQAQVRRLGVIGTLPEVARLIQAGKTLEAAEMLRGIASKLLEPGKFAEFR